MDAMVISANGDFNLESIKQKLAPRVQELNDLALELAKAPEKDEFSYLVTGMAKLTSMMMDCDQYDIKIEKGGEPFLTDKVVRVNRFVNNFFLDKHGVDRTMVAGLFVTVPVYILPADRVHKAMKNRFKTVMNPEEFGLPSLQDADYCTIKGISGSSYMVLAKFADNYANEMIFSPRHYDYVGIR